MIFFDLLISLNILELVVWRTIYTHNLYATFGTLYYSLTNYIWPREHISNGLKIKFTTIQLHRYRGNKISKTMKEEYGIHSDRVHATLTKLHFPMEFHSSFIRFTCYEPNTRVSHSRRWHKTMTYRSFEPVVRIKENARALRYAHGAHFPRILANFPSDSRSLAERTEGRSNVVMHFSYTCPPPWRFA